MLIVEDIVDTGKTMVKLLETVNKFGPKQIKVCRFKKNFFLKIVNFDHAVVVIYCSVIL